MERVIVNYNKQAVQSKSRLAYLSPLTPTVLQLPEGVAGHAQPHGLVLHDHVLPRLLAGVVPQVRVSSVRLHQDVEDVLVAELAGEVEGRVPAVRLLVDVQVVVAGQQLDHVHVA